MIKHIAFLMFAPIACLVLASDGDSPGASGPNDGTPSSDHSSISDWAYRLTGGDDYNWDHGADCGGSAECGDYSGWHWGPKGGGCHDGLPARGANGPDSRLMSFDDTARAALHEAPGANGPDRGI